MVVGAADTPRKPPRPSRSTKSSRARTLPHDLSCEASILGGILIRNESLADLEDLEIDDFHHWPHKVVFEAIRNIEAVGKPIDLVTLEAELARRGKLDAIGGIAFLGELALRVPTADHVRAYRDTVLQLSRNRKAILELESALERAYNWPHDPIELVSETIGQLSRFDAIDQSRSKNERARWCLDLSTFLGDAEPDDDDSIDWVIRDIIPRGENALFGGPMKAGKTWAAIDLLISVALGEDWLGKFENTMREPARALGVFMEDNERRIRKRLWELCRAHNTTPNNPLIRDHLRISRAPLRLPDAKDQRRFTNELKQWKPALVVIDNLTRVLVGDPNSTRDAAAFARAWTEITEETGACIMFLHHTRKASGTDQKTGQIDPFDTLRGSGDFGAAARNILVTTPLRTETELLAEVRMRGNLDLRRSGFVLGFERIKLLDKWRAKLVDRGDIETVKQDVRQQQRSVKEEQKRREMQAEYHRRREIALHIAHIEGSISGPRFARELGLSSARGKPAELLAQLARERLLRPDRIRGYLPYDAPAQEDLPGTSETSDGGHE